MFTRHLSFLLVLLASPSGFALGSSVEIDKAQEEPNTPGYETGTEFGLLPITKSNLRLAQGVGNDAGLPKRKKSETAENPQTNHAQPVDDSVAMAIEKEIAPLLKMFTKSLIRQSAGTTYSTLFSRMRIPSNDTTELIMSGKVDKGEVTIRIEDHSIYEMGSLSSSQSPPNGLKPTYEYFDGNWRPVIKKKEQE